MDFISFPADTFLKILIYIVIDGNVFEFFDIWRHWCINIFTATDNFFVFFTTWNKTLAFACSLCIIFIIAYLVFLKFYNRVYIVYIHAHTRYLLLLSIIIVINMYFFVSFRYMLFALHSCLLILYRYKYMCTKFLPIFFIY